MRVKQLAETMRDLPPETFLISATRLGGRHGYDAAGAQSTMGGAVTGFTKALTASGRSTSSRRSTSPPLARPPRSRTRSSRRRCTTPAPSRSATPRTCAGPSGSPSSRPADDPARELKPDDVFLITGAAGSIVSAIAADLAAASHGTFHLLDLVPAPDPADPDLARFAADRDGLKRETRRPHARGRREADAETRRARAGPDRARPRGARRDRGDRGPAGPRTGTRRTSPTPTQVGAAVEAALEGERAHRRARPRRRPRDQPLPARQAAAGVRPRLRRQGRRLAPHPRGAGRGRPRAAVVFSSIAGRFGTPARPTTRPPTTCCARRSRSSAPRASTASRSTGPPGRRSAWRAAARSRR